MIPKRILTVTLTIICMIALIGCTNRTAGDSDNDKLTVAVSIIPQKAFVKAVAGNLADVVVMVPPGHSPANYQPSPGEMKKLSQSSLYFSVGVPTEKANILPEIEEFNSNLEVISLADRVDKVYPHHRANDPHIWMSPKRVKVMVEVIAEELGKRDEKNKEIYEKNAGIYIQELDALDSQIKETLKNRKKTAFIIYHPSLGYFADDYNLEMIPVERSGKEATAQQLQNIIDTAKEKNIKVVFYQAEIDSAQSRTLAQEIGGSVEQVKPLAPDYIENLRKIAQTFKRVLQ